MDDDLNESVALTIYGSLGQPLVHVVPVEHDAEFTHDEMSGLMKLFNGASNGDSHIDWEEVF